MQLDKSLREGGNLGQQQKGKNEPGERQYTLAHQESWEARSKESERPLPLLY